MFIAETGIHLWSCLRSSKTVACAADRPERAEPAAWPLQFTESTEHFQTSGSVVFLNFNLKWCINVPDFSKSYQTRTCRGNTERQLLGFTSFPRSSVICSDCVPVLYQLLLLLLAASLICVASKCCVDCCGWAVLNGLQANREQTLNRKRSQPPTNTEVKIKQEAADSLHSRVFLEQLWRNPPTECVKVNEASCSKSHMFTQITTKIIWCDLTGSWGFSSPTVCWVKPFLKSKFIKKKPAGPVTVESGIWRLHCNIRWARLKYFNCWINANKIRCKQQATFHL